MGVVFKGGTSGNRQDAKAPVPSSGNPQPVLDTATSGAVPSTVHLNAERAREHAQAETPEFMPTGGTIPAGTDVEDSTAQEGKSWGPGVNAVNTPYTGER